MNGLRIEALRYLGNGPIDLKIDAGECVTLAGPSGSGKTLLLRAVADLDESRGEVFLDDMERMSIPAPEWRRRVGLLPAESAWWSERVGDHLPGTDPAMLEKLGFSADVVDWQIARLSSGERQRLALARLLTLGPAVLLLDEPTANLDTDSTEVVEAIVEDYREAHRAAVLWVTHDPLQAARVGRRRLHIEQGQLTSEPQ